MKNFDNRFESRGVFCRVACWGLVVACVMVSASCGSAGAKGEARANADAWDSAMDRPPTSRTLYTMARILTAQGRDGEAEFVLVRILKSDPDFTPAYVAMADLQIRGHKMDEAIKTLTAGLARSPGDGVILNNLGMCQVVRADYSGALDYFNRAVQADPRNPKYAGNRAMALGMLGRYDEALASYYEMVAPSASHYNLAVLCDARGDRDRALSEYAEAALLKQQEKEAADKGESPRATARLRPPVTEVAPVLPTPSPEPVTAPVAAPTPSTNGTPAAAAEPVKEPEQKE